jgi:sulfur-oxidizing protein SoxY
MTKHDVRIDVLDRRSLVISAAAAAMLLAARNAHADDVAPAPVLERSKQFADAYAALVAGGTPLEGKITLELPEVAENGNFVPLTVSVDSPMTEQDHVKTIHILSTANPVARIASFHLSPANAIAKVQSRIRLAKSQEVMALAHLSNGLMLLGTTTVKVTIGGCAS